MIKLVDAINFLQSNGYIVCYKGKLHNIVEVKTKKTRYSELTSMELANLVEKMMIGI
jgi:hypothetical protein